MQNFPIMGKRNAIRIKLYSGRVLHGAEQEGSLHSSLQSGSRRCSLSKEWTLLLALSFHRAIPGDAGAAKQALLQVFSPIELVLISALCLELNRQLQTRRKEVVTPMPMGKALMLQEGLSTTSICTKFMERLPPQGPAKASSHFCCF